MYCWPWSCQRKNRMSSWRSKKLLRPLQDGFRPVMRKVQEVIDIFTDLAVLSYLVTAGVKLGERQQLFSIEIKSGISDLCEKGRYAIKRTRGVAFLDFDHQVWHLAP